MKSIINQLKVFLENKIPIDSKDWSYIVQFLKPIEVPKETCLTEEGTIESKLYFVGEGIVHMYHEKQEKDITINFGFPQEFISSYSSFLTGNPSEFNLTTLTPCTLIEIKKEDLQSIYENTTQGEHLGRIFAEQFFLYLSKRETSFMLNSPTERYLALFDEQPRLIKEIPLKYLASYIGITPQALSRIRAKIT